MNVDAIVVDGKTFVSVEQLLLGLYDIVESFENDPDLASVEENGPIAAFLRMFIVNLGTAVNSELDKLEQELEEDR